MSETRADLITLDASTLVPAVVFAEGGVDKILADLTRQVRTISTDISTPQGRADIKSLAYKIARSKTALDSAGKQLGEDWRKRVDGINADRRRIRDELDALAEEVRAPLTQWENAEKARVEGHENTILALFAMSQFEGEPEIAEIERRIDSARHLQGARDWQEFTKRASDTAITVIADLMTLRDHWTRVYADRAETERLREVVAAQLQRERDARIAATAAQQAKLEAEDKAAREAAAAEERARRQREAAEEKARQERAAAELAAHTAAENARLAREAVEARARRDAEAAEERRRNEAIAAEAARLAEVRARKEAEERARLAEITRKAEADTAERNRIVAAEKAERGRLQAIEDERARVAAEQQALADAGAAREADRKHKAKIHREARDAITLAMVDTAKSATVLDPSASAFAEAIVSAIARGLVPHIKVVY